MKLLTAPTTPSWLEIAIEKAKMAKGAHESQEPLFSFAKGCLELGGSTARPDDNDKGKIYKIIDEPVVSCIVVMTNYKKSDGKSKGSGHITFLYGIDGNNLVCLGGNQGSHLKFSNYKREVINSNKTSNIVNE